MSDSARETLEGTVGAEEQAGGLQVPSRERHVFKAPAPKTSLLGECPCESGVLLQQVVWAAPSGLQGLSGVQGPVRAAGGGAQRCFSRLVALALRLQGWTVWRRKSALSRPSRAAC